MDREYTVFIGDEEIILSVEQLTADLWQSTANFRGVPYACHAKTARSAKQALLIALESEASHPHEPPYQP